MPDFAYPDAPVYIQEIPMGRIPSTIGQGPSVAQTITVVASADPYTLSTLGVPAGVDVTVQMIGSGGGGGGKQSPGTGAGGGGGGPAGVVFTVPAATWALDGTLVVPFGGAGSGAGAPGGQGDDSVFTIGSNVVTVAGAPGGLSPGDTPVAGGTVTFSAADFTLVMSRPGKPGGTSSGSTGGAGGVLSWGGSGGKGANNSETTAGNATDSVTTLTFTP